MINLLIPPKLSPPALNAQTRALTFPQSFPTFLRFVRKLDINQPLERITHTTWKEKHSLILNLSYQESLHSTSAVAALHLFHDESVRPSDCNRTAQARTEISFLPRRESQHAAAWPKRARRCHLRRHAQEGLVPDEEGSNSQMLTVVTGSQAFQAGRIVLLQLRADPRATKAHIAPTTQRRLHSQRLSSLCWQEPKKELQSTETAAVNNLTDSSCGQKRFAAQNAFDSNSENEDFRLLSFSLHVCVSIPDISRYTHKIELRGRRQSILQNVQKCPRPPQDQTVTNRTARQETPAPTASLSLTQPILLPQQALHGSQKFISQHSEMSQQSLCAA